MPGSWVATDGTKVSHHFSVRPPLLGSMKQATAHPPRLSLAASAMENVESDVFRKNQTEENMAYASIILHIVPPAVVLGTRST